MLSQDSSHLPDEVEQRIYSDDLIARADDAVARAEKIRAAWQIFQEKYEIGQSAFHPRK
jgi:hypothetical protein